MLATLADRQFRHCDKILNGREMLILILKNPDIYIGP